MKTSGIGGQALMEGVMMKNKDHYALAVRLTDGSIYLEESYTKNLVQNQFIRKIPIVRGVIMFIESMTLGIKTLTKSASFFEEEEEEADPKKTKAALTGAVILAVILAVSLFMVLPYGISLLFSKVIYSVTALSLLEGGIRLLIFFLYVFGISKVNEIKRVFMYHGAEHKCINCIEHGMELTVENVRASSRLHKRCGTSFLLIIMMFSILFFALIQFSSPLLRLIFRLLLIPFIAGISYEFLKMAGKKDSVILDLLSKPGLWMQKLTTGEPDDTMIEVGIKAVDAVFDWKAFVEEQRYM